MLYGLRRWVTLLMTRKRSLKTSPVIPFSVHSETGHGGGMAHLQAPLVLPVIKLSLATILHMSLYNLLQKGRRIWKLRYL